MIGLAETLGDELAAEIERLLYVEHRDLHSAAVALVLGPFARDLDEAVALVRARIKKGPAPE